VAAPPHRATARQGRDLHREAAVANIPDERTPRFHPTAAAIESIPAGLRLDGLQVLLVDDDPDALALGNAILTRAGGTTRTWSSASQALEILRTWRPDGLVSDIEMPGKDGNALIQEIRARRGTWRQDPRCRDDRARSDPR